MTERVYVTAKFTAKADRIKDMIDLLTDLASKTRGESGCVEYGYYQSADDSTVFTSFEIWADPESEAAHWNTQHLKGALTHLPDLMVGEAEINKYSKIA